MTELITCKACKGTRKILRDISPPANYRLFVPGRNLVARVPAQLEEVTCSDCNGTGFVQIETEEAGE